MHDDAMCANAKLDVSTLEEVKGAGRPDFPNRLILTMAVMRLLRPAG